MDKQNQVDAGQHPAQANSTTVTPNEQRMHPPPRQGWHLDRLNIFNNEIYLSEFVEDRTYVLVSLLGYGLLAFALFDYVYILTPLRFTNPVWEFQTIGAMVEHAAIPLLGMALIFYRHQGYIRELEKKFLGCLSWVCLLLGLLYLLMVPLGIIDSWRIYQVERANIVSQITTQNQQIEQIKTQLEQAKTDEQLEQLLAKITPPGVSPEVKNPQAIKNKLLSEMSQAQRQMKSQADTVDETKKQALLKNSVKWNLGALVAGTLFILIWHFTDWARNNI
jgi:hypothetical protein